MAMAHHSNFRTLLEQTDKQACQALLLVQICCEAHDSETAYLTAKLLALVDMGVSATERFPRGTTSRRVGASL